MSQRTLVKIVVSLVASIAVAPAAADYTLDAPERAHIRETIEVGWTAPEPRGGLIEIRPAEGGRAATYAYANANPQPILAPEPPGDYQVVYVFEREVRASRPLTVYVPEAALEVPATVDAGASFEVQWAGPDSRSDRITLAARGGEPVRGMAYAYTGNARDGLAKLRAPTDEGVYDVVYVSGSTVLARAPIRVGSIAASLDHEPQVRAGGRLGVIWEGPRNDQDRVTFATRDGEPMRAASYAYVANGEDNAVTLTAPEETGPLDVVYVSGGRVIGRSPVDVVPASVTLDAPREVVALERFAVTWQGGANRGDRLVVRSQDEDELIYGYVDPDEPATTLKAPAEVGEHALAFVTRGGRTLATRTIGVRPAPVEPGRLVVEEPRSTLRPDDAVAVIFDASGSMLQRIDGVRRVEIARNMLAELLNETIPPGTGFALRVFGHREPGSCRTDLEIPLGPLEPGAATATIEGIEAKNLARTPLGDSIAKAATDLAEVSGRRVLIVLTDGEETCDGDPAAAIKNLHTRGWDLTVNIVGFAIDDEALAAEFESWAALGGGAYYSAASRSELAEALTQAAAVTYTVSAAGGGVVAKVRPGEPVSLPAGDYVVRGGGDAEATVTVPPGGSVRIAVE